MKDDFNRHFEELLYKGFIEQVGTDEPDAEPKYILTEKAEQIFELMEFLKDTDAILKKHGRR